MTSVLVVAPLAVVLADDTLRKWFGASLAVRARPSRSPKAAPTVAVSQPAESPTLANSKTHSHGHPRWYSIGYKRSLRFSSFAHPIVKRFVKSLLLFLLDFETCSVIFCVNIKISITYGLDFTVHM